MNTVILSYGWWRFIVLTFTADSLVCAWCHSHLCFNSYWLPYKLNGVSQLTQHHQMAAHPTLQEHWSEIDSFGLYGICVPVYWHVNITMSGHITGMKLDNAKCCLQWKKQIWKTVKLYLIYYILVSPGKSCRQYGCKSKSVHLFVK
jgi:hypothetical protein